MRVLHLLEATQGGTRRHVLDLLPGLAQLGVENHLIYSPLRNPEFEMDAANLRQHHIGAVSVPMTTSWRAGINGAAVVSAGRIMRRLKPDLVHCHSTAAGVVGRLAAAFTSPGLPVVYTPHCVALATAMPLATQRAARRMEGLLAPLTAHTIAVSAQEALLLRRTVLPRGALTLIYNGLDLAAFDAAAKSSAVPELAARPPGDLVLGCFGRLSRQKNQEVLILALGLLRREAVPARLVLVGAGTGRDRMNRLAERLGVADRVHWCGQVLEPRPLYAACDLVCQPSLWEGCPYAVLEAMAARRPVIASPVGAVPHLLGNSGKLCPPEPANLASAVRELQRQPEALLLQGEQLRRRVEQKFGLQEMVEKTLAVYRSVG